MNFICLQEHGCDRKIHLVVSHISAILSVGGSKDDEAKGCVVMDYGQYIQVRETPEEIFSLIEDALL